MTGAIRPRLRAGRIIDPIDLNVQGPALRELDRIRRQQGISALDLELASGVSEAGFRDLLAGRRQATLRQAVQLADAVGLRVVLVAKGGTMAEVDDDSEE